MFTVAGLFPLKPVMLLMPCHMLLGLLLLNCSSTLFFILSFGCFDGSPEIVTGLFRSSVFPDLKADVRADKADRTSLLIHGFWLGVDAYRFGRNNILYTRPYETRYRI